MNFPLGSIAIATERVSVGKGLPATDLSVPVLASMVYAETLPATPPPLAFATYKYVPLGSMTAAAGLLPAAKGLPGIAPSTPVLALTVNAETSLDALFATYANFPLGAMPMDSEPEPALNGLPVSVNAPVAASIT